MSMTDTEAREFGHSRGEQHAAWSEPRHDTPDLTYEEACKEAEKACPAYLTDRERTYFTTGFTEGVEAHLNELHMSEQ